MPTSPLLTFDRLLLLAVLIFPTIAWPQNPGADAAVSSQAVATQPDVPKRADEVSPPTPATPATQTPNITSEQTLLCGKITVILPAGTYAQKLLVENPAGRHAIDGTDLQPQAIGLGYIRYASDVPLQINGVQRGGGLDIPIRKEDNLPVRVWYKKMTEVDPWTKAFTFILPPVGLIAGAGAWSSGNILLPDPPPAYTEARDYYLKTPAQKDVLQEGTQPAVRLAPSSKSARRGLRSP